MSDWLSANQVQTNIGNLQQVHKSRRRKSQHKPRRIAPEESLKDHPQLSPSKSDCSLKMIDIQESIMSNDRQHVSSKSNPTPVDSPNSDYNGVRSDEPAASSHSPTEFNNLTNGSNRISIDYKDESLKISLSASTEDNKTSPRSSENDLTTNQLQASTQDPSTPKQDFQPSTNLVHDCKSPGKPSDVSTTNFTSPFTSSPISSAYSLVNTSQTSSLDITRESLNRLIQPESNGSIMVPVKKEPRPNMARGLVGLGVNEIPIMAPDGVSQDGVPRYKRPPHTYPALIASAILDSPNNLVTLRGIYDYIMNNFPYYKFCHDKSAWQNSIRHNLSLNQCFIKVPRYENAAKSNYWTMNQEGFEEFGSENSFKRRRRRGASIPITKSKANKNKLNGETGPTEPSNQDGTHSPYMFNPAHLLAFRGATFWHDQSRDFANNRMFAESSLQNSSSNIEEPAAKVQRMVVLKQGDGPVLNLNNEEVKRPNSLSSLEDMRGAVHNTFNKNLIDSSSILTKNSISTPQQILQAAQKSLIANSNMVIPNTSLQVSGSRNSSPGANKSLSGENEAGNNESRPVFVDDVEIGTETLFRRSNETQIDSNSVISRHFRCRFCVYSYVGASILMLENHIKIFHTTEINSLKKFQQNHLQQKLLLNQTTNGQNGENPQTSSNNGLSSKDSVSDRFASLQNMVGMNSQSMLAAAAAHNNAQTIIQAAAAAQQAGSFGSNVVDERNLRNEQKHNQQQQPSTNDQFTNIDARALQRQALNNAIQQAVNPENLRLFYQQFALQNPLLSTNPLSSNFPNQLVSNSTNGDPSNDQFPLHLWHQYQQRFLGLQQQLKVNGNQNSPPFQQNRAFEEGVKKNSQENSQTEEGAFDPKKGDSRGWKKCDQCEFTAKGSHGLETHQRSTHGDSPVASNDNESSDRKNSPISSPYERNTEKLVENATSTDRHQRPGSATPYYPTPPLSNSPPYSRRVYGSIDSSDAPRKSSLRLRTISTQTDVSGVSRDTTTSTNSSATCSHCDVTFGDDMMLALHMSCHDKTDPFVCTICGQQCHEKYYFNVHLLRGLHQSGNGNSAGRQSSNAGGSADSTRGSNPSSRAGSEPRLSPR